MSIPILHLTESDISAGSGFLHQFSVNETYAKHTHDFYELFFILKGKAIHRVNNQIQLITPGSFVFIRPADKHSYDFFNYFDLEMMSIGFPKESFNKALLYTGTDYFKLTNPVLPPHAILSMPEYQVVKDILLKIGKERTEIFFLAVLPYLLSFFINAKDNDAHIVLPEWLITLIIQVEQEDIQTFGLHSLITLSHVSQEHLNRSFKKYLSLTPTEFINQRRINHAATLLLEGHYTISDICYMSGFGSLSHFYHQFNDLYGCSPKQFCEHNTLLLPLMSTWNPI